MTRFLLTVLMTLALSAAFRPVPMRMMHANTLRMSEEPKKEVTIVPVDATSIETSASIAGGVVGLLLAGPVGALVAAAIAKYSSKKDNEAGEALRGIGKSVVESYNFLNKLNAKYEISTKTGNAIKATLESSSADSETIDSIKGATTKIGDLNNEYDIVGKSKQVCSRHLIRCHT